MRRAGTLMALAMAAMLPLGGGRSAEAVARGWHSRSAAPGATCCARTATWPGAAAAAQSAARFDRPRVLVASGVAARALAASAGDTDAVPRLQHAPAAQQAGATCCAPTATWPSATGAACCAPTVLDFTDAHDANRVFEMGGGAPPATVAGSGTAGFHGDGGDATLAQFHLKMDSRVERSGIAVAADGSLFIADTGNATIRRVAGPDTSEPGVIRSVAGRWAPPQNVALAEPMGLALDRAGNLYIADHGANAVVMLHAATGAPATAGQLEILAHMVSPASVAVTPDGSRVFAASPETGAVMAIDTATRALDEVIAPRQASPASAAPVPAGLAADGAGNLFVATTGPSAEAQQILRFAAGSRRRDANSVFAGGLHSPGELAFDDQGNLFVANQGDDQILEFPGAGVMSPSVTLAPASFDFGDEPTGGTTLPAQTFTLTNNSGGAISDFAISFTGADPADFLQSGTTCAGTLASGGTCTISVSFTPAASGARAAMLSVASSFPTPATAAVSGTGDDYELALAASQINTLTVMNGDAATFNLQGTNDGVFLGAVTLVCPGNLPVETTCTFSPATLNFTAPLQTIPFTVTYQTTTRNPKKHAAAAMAAGPAGAACCAPAGSASVTRAGGPQFPALLAVAGLLALGVAIWPRVRRGIAGDHAAAGATCCAPTRAIWPRRARGAAATIVLGVALAAALLGGCHHHFSQNTGTPPGTTQLIVQGTAQNASRAASMTLIVQ